MAKASVWIKHGLLSLGSLLVALVLLSVLVLQYFHIPANAAGMAAKGVCSAAFVAGRPWQKMMAEDVLPASPVLRLISIVVNETDRTVTGTFAGFSVRTAVWLPDRGCVLDGARAASPNPTTPSAATRPNPDADNPWPQGEAPLPLAQWGAGVDASALKQVVVQAFIGTGDPLAANARGVAVIHKGRLLILRTAPGFSPQTALHGW